MDNNNFREKIKNAQRIVFKFGTNVLRNDYKEISLSRIYTFIEDIAQLKKLGKEPIIVTSGAVGLGAKRLSVDSSESMSVKQACAAVGQSRLMSIYEDGFDKGVKTFDEAAKCERGSDGIRMQCQAVIDYVTDIFGEEQAKKVFGESTDLLECMDILEEMYDMYEKHITPKVTEKKQELIDRFSK